MPAPAPRTAIGSRSARKAAIATDPETEERYPIVYRIRPAVEGLEYR
jgi:hypothetical protein